MKWRSLVIAIVMVVVAALSDSDGAVFIASFLAGMYANEFEASLKAE